MPMKLVVEGDSSAAMGICSRLGVGKIRHMDVKYLWLQQKVADKVVHTKKIGTDGNVADLMTKALEPTRHHELMSRLPMTLVTARGERGSAVASLSSSTFSIASIAVYVDDVALIGYAS